MDKKQRQINFNADNDVFEFVSNLAAGTKGPTLNRIIRDYLEKQKRRQSSDLEGFCSYLEKRCHGNEVLAESLAVLINGYYQTMHDDSVHSLDSHGELVPVDHRPCKYCGDHE